MRPLMKIVVSKLHASRYTVNGNLSLFCLVAKRNFSLLALRAAGSQASSLFLSISVTRDMANLITRHLSEFAHTFQGLFISIFGGAASM
jgi:Na+-transporting NADH:ubiquinone oxidoreductase subunit NqrA